MYRIGHAGAPRGEPTPSLAAGLGQACLARADRSLVCWGELVPGPDALAVFRTLRDIAVPASARDLFIDLPESAFRVDLSSTAIRAQMAG